ncbi:tripartite tricarboxylate transporter TctB family protein [Desulfovibrio sp. OttesenSCG-928-O18]|nr:tripartite tricarboxylate transporter TctB family protein [Desulfovibrio sp. OttesenSCG-928-O18]
MTFNESRVGIFGGIFWILFGMFLYFYLIPDQIADAKQYGVSPRYVPNAVAGLICLIGAAMSVTGYLGRNKKKQAQYTFHARELRFIVFSLLVIMGNIVAFTYVGYLAPAMVAIAVLMYGYGNRNYIKIALYSVIVPLCIKYFFAYTLQMYLP